MLLNDYHSSKLNSVKINNEEASKFPIRVFFCSTKVDVLFCISALLLGQSAVWMNFEWFNKFDTICANKQRRSLFIFRAWSRLWSVPLAMLRDVWCRRARLRTEENRASFFLMFTFNKSGVYIESDLNRKTASASKMMWHTNWVSMCDVPCKAENNESACCSFHSRQITKKNYELFLRTFLFCTHSTQIAMRI